MEFEITTRGRKPIIGITSGKSLEIADDEGGRVFRYCYCGYEYINAIEQAGGLPIVIPVFEEMALAETYIGMIDGLLLSGGGDISPHLFGEEPHQKLGAVDLERDLVEMELTKLALERDLPIFAICRGIQVLNVAAGGTLYQDLSQHSGEVLKHRQRAAGWYGSHTIKVAEGSLLYKIVGKSTIYVNSYHHQAVKMPAEGFVVSATSLDGIVEAIESPQHRFVIGVQFHPEMMWRRHPEAAALFRSFVEACRDG
ncbi:TPA: gamma-glutamyl-gamma-aminobutyrate hydrolase family protein [Candidatus Poribacteria bacterium]|nr:gamma-glutamyl-gamma-aminobutyrate hydrolase family protein [Candidatus Poribacteria bacterium]